MGSAERVARYLETCGAAYEPREFDSSTRNSELAARALGCTIAEIAKTVVFVSTKPVAVTISGDKRVDPSKLERLLGVPVKVATADEVKALTGYPVGGVPPFPHGNGVSVKLDRSLARFDHVWAAAGTPNAVFRMKTSDLTRLVGALPLDLALDS